MQGVAWHGAQRDANRADEALTLLVLDTIDAAEVVVGLVTIRRCPKGDVTLHQN